MIIAMSRFRVANGMEQSVAAAFINRPHLVDTARGFLGMETFTDTKDEAVFYLVTRWTDADSYRTWHRSAAHQQSHKFIPKGLKLDPSYTKVVEMKRLGDAATVCFAEAVADHWALFSTFLAESECVYLIAASGEGQITACNDALARRLRCAPSDINGRRVWSILTETDAAGLRERIEGARAAPPDRFLLNFVDAAQSPFTLACRLSLHAGGFLLVGEELRRKEQALDDELLKLNNELAVLTRENARKKRELQAALEQLRQAQSMLVHREKMASLGQMTAGVAHEINNPLAFISGNHGSLQRDFEALLSFINVIGDAMDEIGPALPRLQERILAKAEEIDLSHLAEAVPRKFAHSGEGLERVKNIVLDLRNFSRLDEDVLKPADVAEGITSTLRFLTPLLNEREVTVRTTFAEMPPLLCSPGTLNQAFSNIITNAVQASHAGQEVLVGASVENGLCLVTVEDHGEGITAENLPKVFDPFFTTKGVGEGTGLGLHISHQIVAAHRGEIKISSSPGQGTNVRVELPFRTRAEPQGEAA